MRFLVLGGGLQGTACAFDLLRQDAVTAVTIADVREEPPTDFLSGDSRLAWRTADFQDEDEVAELVGAHEVVLSAAPYYLNADLARLAIERGRHFSDLGGNTGIVFRQMEMDEEARASGSTVVPDVGLAPGIVNVLAAEGIRRLDRAESIRMYVGGLPQNPEPPLGYQVVYSLEGALDYYTTPSWVIRDGKRQQVDALSELEQLEFEELGTLEAFHTGGGASVLPWRFEGHVDELYYKTLRYPGHAGTMRAVRELGLLSQDPVEVDGVRVAPRDVFIACVEPRLTRPEEPDLVALRVVAEGVRDGREAKLIWDLLDREDPETGITAMERCTGFTLSIVGLMMGRGTIEGPGVLPPDEGVPAGALIEELAERGIEIRFREGG